VTKRASGGSVQPHFVHYASTVIATSFFKPRITPADYLFQFGTIDKKLFIPLLIEIYSRIADVQNCIA
jgi:hypothetical protein